MSAIEIIDIISTLLSVLLLLMYIYLEYKGRKCQDENKAKIIFKIQRVLFISAGITLIVSWCAFLFR